MKGLVTSFRSWLIFVTVIAFFPCAGFALNQPIEAANADLTDLSLEDLMNINITSVSKKTQQVSEAPAAVFVITNEDIRRSAATTIPDVLRMVPGLQVAKLDGNKWAITARGSNGRFSNKLLVLMDGRSVYTPLYSGVFWENIDTVLEDIDRIEVIRGPGASLWGANAVNGVINIITKSAEDTTGTLVSGLAGSEEKGNVSVRYGANIGKETPFRVYVKGFDRDGAVDENGDDTPDDWHYLRGGFRIDHQSEGRDLFTIQGDIFDGSNGETIAKPIPVSPYLNIYENDHKEKGHNLLSRWTRSFSEMSEMTLQAYYDHNEHIMHVGTSEIDTFDVEFQHRFFLGQINDITWGLGYRLYSDHFSAVPDLTVLTPHNQSFNVYNAFIQDEIGLFDKRLRLTLGCKYEYNDYTQSEIQPNARLLWKPNDSHSLWTSVSRAVRTPSRVERDSTALMAVIPPPAMGPLPVAVVYYGSDNFESEKLTAYELGYRVQATRDLTLDTAVYYNDYKELRETAIGAPLPVGTPPTYMILPVAGTNRTRGEVYGFELAADWKPAAWFRFQPAYTNLENKINYNANDILAIQDPRHQISLRQSFDLPRNLELDLWYRYVSEVSDSIGGYDTIDIRLGWTYNTHVSFSLAGLNLLDSHHPEIEPEGLHYVSTEVERSVYAKVALSF